MNETHYAKGITAEGLRILLDYWPKLSSEADEVQQMLIEDKDKVLGKGAEPFAWCFLYELPIRQHVTLATALTIQGYAEFLSVEQVTDWYRQFADTPGQIGALPGITRQMDHYFDAIEPSEDDVKRQLPTLAGIFGLTLSMHNSLRCVLYHGCFLNELIERVRAGDDKALFDAIRIDRTVIGCIAG
jgi:hypothetical protein